MAQKKISIIVPAYNGSNTLRPCLDSILTQTGVEDFEIILVDDCSTDGGLTWDLICEYEARYPDSIIALQTEENALPGGARNAGIPYVSGELMTFLDQDDTLTPDAFMAAYQLYKEQVYDLAYFNMDELHIYGISQKSESQFLMIEGQTTAKNLFIVSAPYVVWGNYYKSSLIKDNDIRFTSNSYHEEAPFTMPAITKADKIILSHKRVYNHIDHTSRATYQFLASPDHTHDTAKSILYTISWFLKNPGIFERYRKELEFRFMHILLMNSFISNQVFPGYELTKYIQNIANHYFPDWRHNPYFELTQNNALKADLLTCFEAIMTPFKEEHYAEYAALIKRLR